MITTKTFLLFFNDVLDVLAILFACEKFDKYIFGRDIVNVETDHKPLEEIFEKSLCNALSRLKRLLLRPTLQSQGQVHEGSPHAPSRIGLGVPISGTRCLQRKCFLFIMCYVRFNFVISSLLSSLLIVNHIQVLNLKQRSLYKPQDRQSFTVTFKT